MRDAGKAMSPPDAKGLTRERIEYLRKQIKDCCYYANEHPDIDALCDLALRAIDTGEERRRPLVCCGEWATCIKPCVPRGRQEGLEMAAQRLEALEFIVPSELSDEEAYKRNGRYISVDDAQLACRALKGGLG